MVSMNTFSRCRIGWLIDDQVRDAERVGQARFHHCKTIMFTRFGETSPC